MHTKKIILAISLSFFVSDLAASKVESSSTTNDVSEQRDVSSSSTAQASGTSASTTDGRTAPSQSSNTDKKPSMADYCRKHTC